MKNSPKAVFFDIDGTIINASGGPFADDTAAMEEAVKAGHKLFINTGRSFGNIPPKVLEISFWSGVCAGGGAHVLLAEKARFKTIYHQWVSREQVTQISAWYLDHKKTLVLEGEKDCYLINPGSRSFTVKPGKIITHKDDFAKYHSRDFITKLTLRHAPSREERELLEGSFRINVFEDYAEAVIKSESKAKAIQITIDILAMERENTVALGDSVNDMDMIRYAGLGIAMGNAVAELKEAARAITANCGEGGAAKALRRFVL